MTTLNTVTAIDYHDILARAGLPVGGVHYDGVSAIVTAWSTPPTPEQETIAAALLSDANPVALTANGNVVYVASVDGVTSVELLIGAELVTVELDVFNRATLEIIFPDGVTERAVRCANQPVNGYAEVIVHA